MPTSSKRTSPMRRSRAASWSCPRSSFSGSTSACSGGSSDMLAARGLAKSFGRQEVLCGIDLDVPRSQTLAILGRSGCGKTTLLKILAGLLPADAGTVHLDDREVTEL